MRRATTVQRIGLARVPEALMWLAWLVVLLITCAPITGCGALSAASGLAATFKVVRDARVTICNPKLDVLFDGSASADAGASSDAAATDAPPTNDAGDDR